MRIGVWSLLVLVFSLGCTAPSATTVTHTPSEPAAESTEPEMPKVGAQAPDFALTTVDGKTVALAEAVARGPVVLVFGSFT
jgi:peroxiredoxin